MRNPFKRLGKKTRIFLIVLLVLILIPPIVMGVVCPLITQPLKPTAAPPTGGPAPQAAQIEGYPRPEESTYLTYPEWFIVYSSEEYANFLEKQRPSQFPYFASIGQFWCGYCAVYQITRQNYGFNVGDHFMLWVIGVSYSVELAVKSLYENTVGRLTEWTSSAEKTGEDRFAFDANKRYVAFIYDYPWYEFSFAAEFRALWSQTPFGGTNLIRKWERKLILSAEFGIKTVYGGLIKLGTRLAYGKAPTEIFASVDNVPAAFFESEPRVKKLADLGAQSFVVSIPRYRLFTEVVPAMARQNIRFLDIAGNDEIFLTAVAPRDWDPASAGGDVLLLTEIATDPSLMRLGIKTPVRSLHTLLPALEQAGVKIEHVYDY